MPRVAFFVVATCAIWLLVCLPPAILTSWLLDISTRSAVVTSAFLTLPLTGTMWFAIQSATSKVKWPLLQLIGLTTILVSVLLVTTPLHLFLSNTSVGYCAVLFWAAAAAWAIFSAHNIKNFVLNIRSNKIKRPYRIVQLSDIHAGSRSPQFLQKVISQAQTHQPDFIVITGDLLDSSVVNAEFLKPLSQLTCPVWMSLGNHERYVQLENAIAAIQSQGIKILRDECNRFDDLHVIGIDDKDNPKHIPQQLAGIQIPSDRFSILLYHRPDGWNAARSHNIDLMLAGHTHAGQIWPFGLLVKRQFPQMNGYFTQDAYHMFVSQGTGTWGPTMRLGTQCEMTIINLLPGNI